MATITLPKTNDNGIYITNASSIKPGDIVDLTGKYRYISIEQIPGDPANPIIFRNKGVVTVGETNPIHYGMRLTGKGFKFLIDPVGSDNGLILGSTNVNAGAKNIGIGTALGNSTEYELRGIELVNCSVGFFSNPKTGIPMKNVWVHYCTLREFTGPGSATGPEGFYFGDTSVGVINSKFENCILEDNLLDGMDGDGIQICNGTFIVRRNTIKNYARIMRHNHRNGLQSGGYCVAQIYDNIIDGGKGPALTILGGGKMDVLRNKINNIDLTGLGEDVVYINLRDGGELNFSDNEFSNLKGFRKIISNNTTVTTGSTFKNNKGVTKAQTLLNAKDTWVDGAAPPPPPPPVNLPPVVNSGFDLTIELPLNAVTLNGVSFDPEGGVVTNLWSKFKGGAASIETPNQSKTIVSGLAVGEYIFRLTTTDNKGAVSYDEVGVRVDPEVLPEPEPVIQLFNDFTWRNI